LESLGAISSSDANTAARDYQSNTETPPAQPLGSQGEFDEDLSELNGVEEAPYQVADPPVSTPTNLTGVGSALEKVLEFLQVT
jgi:hypothetical protein